MEANFYVYEYRHPVSGLPIYIGKGRGDRWIMHKYGSSNIHLDRIIKKYGAANVPRRQLIIGLTEEQAFAIERVLITVIGRGNAGSLVNITDGGEGSSGRIATIESREKGRASQNVLWADPARRERQSASTSSRFSDPDERAKASAANKGKSSPMKGKSHTVKTKAKLSAANKGKPPPNKGKSTSDETKIKQSLAKIGKVQSVDHVQKRVARRKGYTHSVSTIEKISLGNKGKIVSAETRKKQSIAKMGNKNRLGKRSEVNLNG